MEKNCKDNQRISSKWCLNTIVTSIIIAISIMTIITEREVGIAITQMW